MLTNSIRDFFNGDTMTGILRFLEAAFLSMTIAFRVCRSCSDLAVRVGSMSTSAFSCGIYRFSTLCDVLMSVGQTSVLCFRRLRFLGAVSSVGRRPINDVTRCFIVSGADFLCGDHGPSEKNAGYSLHYLCGNPSDSGGSLYNTMHCAAEGKWAEFSETGIHTLLLAAAIA